MLASIKSPNHSHCTQCTHRYRIGAWDPGNETDDHRNPIASWYVIASRGLGYLYTVLHCLAIARLGAEVDPALALVRGVDAYRKHPAYTSVWNSSPS